MPGCEGGHHNILPRLGLQIDIKTDIRTHGGTREAELFIMPSFVKEITLWPNIGCGVKRVIRPREIRHMSVIIILS